MTTDDGRPTTAEITNYELRITNEENSPLATRHPLPATRHWPLAAILVLFLLLGFAYSAVNPLHEATDELRHYRFVQHLIQRRSLPVQGEGSGLDCTVQGLSLIHI